MNETTTPHPHRNEMIRYANAPHGTKVWAKEEGSHTWRKLISNPSWVKNTLYIIDDQHAEIRKQFVDDKSKIQKLSLLDKWEDVVFHSSSFELFTAMLYNGNEQFRIKPKEKVYAWCWVMQHIAGGGYIIPSRVYTDEEIETLSFPLLTPVQKIEESKVEITESEE